MKSWELRDVASARHSQFIPITTRGGGAILFLSLGFGGGEMGQPAARELATANGEAITDVGRVLTGTQGQCAFRFVNRHDVPLCHIPAATKSNCGCSALRVADDVLRPGCATQVLVTYRIPGEPGPFKVGGMCTWQTPSGDRVQMRFVASGIAVPPLLWKSDLAGALSFSAEDIREGKAKVVFEGNIPIDWRTLQVSCALPLIKIDAFERSESGAKCRVRCLGTDEADEIAAKLVVHARTRPTESDPRASDFSLWIPVVARQPFVLAITPKSVTVAYKPHGDCTVKFLLRGDGLLETSPIRGVYGSELDTSWKLGQVSSSKSAILTVVLRPRWGEQGRREVPVFVDAGPAGVFRIPVLFR